MEHRTATSWSVVHLTNVEVLIFIFYLYYDVFGNGVPIWSESAPWLFVAYFNYIIIIIIIIIIAKEGVLLIYFLERSFF